MRNRASCITVPVLWALVAVLAAMFLAVPSVSYAQGDDQNAGQQAGDAGDTSGTDDTGDGTTTVDGEQKGELIIIPTDANTGVEYRAYRIFAGDSDEYDSMFGMSWGSTAIADAVQRAIKQEDPSFDPAIAQSGAEFITEKFGQTTLGMSVADSYSFASRLANAIYESDAEYESIKPSQVASLPVGYYLVMTDEGTFDEVDGETGTSPIYAIVSSRRRTHVGEKTDSPTLTKQVFDEGEGEWGKRTISGTGRDVRFRLTLTLPSNYASFPTYRLVVTDKMEHMSVKSVDDVTMSVDDEKVGKVDAAYSNGTLIINVDDLKLLCPSADADSIIEMEYVAQLDRGANMGATGNADTAHLSYTRSPNSTDLGQTAPSSASVYSWGIRIMKHETNHPQIPLDDTEFTVAIANPGDAGVPQKGSYAGYVAEDGSVSQEPVVFRTDGTGTVVVPNLPSGKYVVSEVKVHDGYILLGKDFSLTLEEKSDGNEVGPYDLEATIEGNDRHVTMDAEGSANVGIVFVSVANDKVFSPASAAEATMELLQTGEGRMKLLGVLAVISLVAFVASRILKRKAEQEGTGDA